MKSMSISFPYTAVLLEDDSFVAYDYKVKNDLLVLDKKYEVTDDASFHFRNAILVINTADVLSQYVDSENAMDALEEAYPTINISDVYFDYQNTKNKVITLLKKAVLQKLFQDYSIEKKYFSHVRLGPSLSSIHSSSQQLTSVEMSSYAIASEIKDLVVQNNLKELLNGISHEVYNKRFFEITKWAAITLFLVSLSVNFYYHEHYRNELASLTIRAQSFKNIDKKIDALQESVNANQQLLNNDNSSDINLVRGINELLLNFQEIRFNKLSYQPLKSGLSDNQSIRLSENQIVVEGLTPNKIILDNYIKFLNTHFVVAETSVLLISEDSDKVAFKILVTTNEIR